MSADRVLIVEPSPSERDRLREHLSARGYRLTLTGDGGEALAALRADDFDVVVLDLEATAPSEERDAAAASVPTPLDALGPAPDAPPPALLDAVLSLRPAQELVVVAPLARRADAVAAMRRSGGVRYVLRPLDVEDLDAQLDRISERRYVLSTHARLLNESIQHLEQEGVYGRALELAGELDVDTLAQALVRTAVRELGAREAVLWLPAEGSAAGGGAGDALELRIVARAGTPGSHQVESPFAAALPERPASFSLPGGEALADAPDGVLSGTGAHVARFLPWVQPHALGAVLAHAGTTVGLLELGSPADPSRDYGEREGAMLRTLVRIATLALRNALLVRELRDEASGRHDAAQAAVARAVAEARAEALAELEARAAAERAAERAAGGAPRTLPDAAPRTLRDIGSSLPLPDARAAAAARVAAVHAAGPDELDALGAQRGTPLALPIFTGAAGRELYRARRYGRPLCFVSVVADGLERARVHLGDERFESLAAELGRVVTTAVRTSDLVGRAADSEFHLALPETDYFGALMCMRRIGAAYTRSGALAELREGHRVALSMGAASYPADGDDADGLLDTCRRRVDEDRASLHRRFGLQTLGFWDALARVLGRPDAPAGTALPDATRRVFADAPSDAFTSRIASLGAEFFNVVVDETVRQIARAPETRGVLYVGTPRLALGSILVEGAPELERASTRTCVLVPGDASDALPAQSRAWLTTVGLARVESEPEPSHYRFLLYLSERSAYAFLGRTLSDGRLAVCHSSEAPLVEHLVAKLQERYGLQRRP